MTPRQNLARNSKEHVLSPMQADLEHQRWQYITLVCLQITRDRYQVFTKIDYSVTSVIVYRHGRDACTTYPVTVALYKTICKNKISNIHHFRRLFEDFRITLYFTW